MRPCLTLSAQPIMERHSRQLHGVSVLQVLLLKELEQQKADLLQKAEQLQGQVQQLVACSSSDAADEAEVAAQAGSSSTGSCHKGSRSSSARRATKGPSAAAVGHRPRQGQQRPGTGVEEYHESSNGSSNLLRSALVLSGGAAGAVVAAAVVAVAHGRGRASSHN